MFMANMSHEIRTPITAITGFTEQLLQESFDEKTTRSLKIIKSSSDHLKDIINDILDFSKLQNDKVVLEQVHFSIMQIIEDVNALFEKQAQKNETSLSFSLSPDTPPVLLGDPYRLKQIMINLVSNSVKFTQNGKVHFNVKSNKTSDEKIELILEFTDTGIGIEEEKINLVFEDFTQAEMSTSRKYGGTGLGLSIVKKLVDLHGGTINVLSRKNHGTQITVRIPVLIGDDKNIKTDLVTNLIIPEEIRRLKILVVDDEEFNRLLFKAILDRWGVKHSYASGGSEALDLLKDNHFDLVFMDARMPVIDGIKATQIIRNEMGISESDMQVICVSAAARDEDLNKYENAGMNAFLPKPFTEKMLFNIILSVIKSYSKNFPVNTINKEEIVNASPEKINLDNLYHIVGGDEQIVKQMLIVFLDSTESGLKEMKAALQKGYREQIADTAHKLLPPGRHIGAVELCNLLKKIEVSIQNKRDSFSVEQLIAETVKEFETIKKLVKSHIAEIR
jgi:CheY-like chemotaxis protein